MIEVATTFMLVPQRFEPDLPPRRGITVHILQSVSLCLLRAASRMPRMLSAVAFCMTLSVPSAAQKVPPYVQQVWNVRDGLPMQRLLNATLLQTRDSYLWIGTRSGLVRFDGLRFETFTTDNTEGLPDSRVWHLFETRDGSLLIATGYGYLIRYRDRSFTPLVSDADSTPDPVWITSMFEDAEGTVWVGTATGLLRQRDGVMQEYLPDRIRSAVEDVLVDQDGTLWGAGGGAGLLSVRGDSVRILTAADGLADDDVVRVFLSDDGVIWAQHPEGRLSRVTRRGPSAYRLAGAGPRAAYNLFRDSRGRLWLSVDEQLFQYRAGRWQGVSFGAGLTDLVPAWFSWRSTRIGEDLSRPWYSWHLVQLGEMIPDALAPPPGDEDGGRLRQNRSLQMLRDREDNVWFAGVDRGLVRLKPGLFKTVMDGPLESVKDADAREELNIYAIAESRDGSMWFGGLLSTLTQLRPDGVFRRYGRPDEFSFPSWAIHEDRNGNLWVNGALCLRDATGSCAAFEAVEPLQARIIRVTAEDRRGTLWFGTDDGLMRLEPGPDPSKPHLGTWKLFTEHDGLPHRKVQALYPGGDDALWMGTNGGGVVRLKDGRFTQWTVEDGLSSNRINAVCEDERGVLWAASEDLGLMRVEFDRDRGSTPGARITVVQKEQGLYSNGLQTILEDDQGRLWMSTRRGVFWVEREALDAYADGRLDRVSSKAYTSVDGLVDQEANGSAGHVGLRATDGRLWFATQAGAAVIDPADVKPNLIPPPVVIEAARSHLVSVPIGDRGVVLDPDQRDFEISFTGLSLSDPAHVHFRYRLEDYDETWVDAGTRRAATYTKVPAGHYTFRVIAANSDGVWNEQGAALTIVVAPFLYETWWFRLLVVLVLVGAVVVLDRMRVRKLVRRKEELKAVVEERTQALRAEKEKTEAQAQRLLELDRFKSHAFENVSHEYRTPLTLIMGPLQQLLDGRFGKLPESARPPHEMMLRNSRRLLRFTNQILDLARVESGLYQPDMDSQDVVPLIQEAVRVFGPLADRRGISLNALGVLQDDGAPVVRVISFDREMLREVISNLLSNALKFTPEGGHVTVCLRDSSGGVEIEVLDTGPGIPPQELATIFDRFSRVENGQRGRHEGSGIGLSIVKEFTELHGGTVQVRSTPGEGSAFTVCLPKTEEAESGPQGARSAVTERADMPAPDDAWLVLEPDLLPMQVEARDEMSMESEDRVTVLVVDDNAEIRTFVGSILLGEYRVLEARDGAEGLATAREALPDLIIADVMMPIMDGLSFNRELKQDPDLACIPVILLTARATAADRVVGLETEADAYLTKPFEPDVLAASVRSLLRIRHRLRDQLVRSRGTQGGLVEKDASAHPTPSLTELCEKARQVVLDNLENSDFSVDQFADVMAMSRWQLRRRLVEEAGSTPISFMRRVRLEEAAQLLVRRAGNVSEIAYAVGFQSLSHFSRSFRAQYDVSPSEFQEGNRGVNGETT